MSGPSLGVVADDLTGACDLADAVCEEGLAAVVLVGAPKEPLPVCDCAVVALPSRTAPVAEAVADSVAAGRALLAGGAAMLYQKYCSTFDSTDEGNIGPIADALRALLGDDVASIGTPATPPVGRTVYQGHLFVGRQLLSQSPLRDHPLTPMRDSDVVAVLGRQTPARVAGLPRPVAAGGRSGWVAGGRSGLVAGGRSGLVAAVEDAYRAGVRHLLLDALDDADLDVAAAALLRLADDGGRFLTGGGAGLAAALARALSLHPGRRASTPIPVAGPRSRRLIVSGSCSARTREQVAAFPGPTIGLSPLDLAADASGAIARILDEVGSAYASGADAVLVTSSAAPDQVADFAARLGPGTASRLLEAAAGDIALRAVEAFGVQRLLVAGGETSGAVARALGLTALRVGPRVGPGLAWMAPADGAPVALLLKSGNFGAPELFSTAWDSCP